ncbi:MAG TPA: hypothetical protein VK464_16795 [Symbiobacteriaceae bacterium]|jgi:hypothetical protein|nr:hypothetical protein [Symbiobacteriaceae bacterium]
MHDHCERPNTRLERYITIGVLPLAAGAAGWLVRAIAGTPSQPHPREFLGIALLAGLLLYTAWLLWALSTVRYRLEDDQLVLTQAWSRVALPLDRVEHLYRWRRRWSWAGHAQRDLQVDEVDLFPTLWVGRSEATWVVLGDDWKGKRRAVAMRPSAALLAFLRERVRHETERAG